MLCVNYLNQLLTKWINENSPSEEDSSPALLIEGDVKLNTPNGSSLSPFFVVDTYTNRFKFKLKLKDKNFSISIFKT